jgi:hypothetical protein
VRLPGFGLGVCLLSGCGRVLRPGVPGCAPAPMAPGWPGAFAGQYRDALLAVADGGDSPCKIWRRPRSDEITAAASADDTKFAACRLLNPREDFDHQLINIDLTLTTAEGHTADLETSIRDAGGRPNG